MTPDGCCCCEGWGAASTWRRHLSTAPSRRHGAGATATRRLPYRRGNQCPAPPRLCAGPNPWRTGADHVNGRPRRLPTRLPAHVRRSRDIRDGRRRKPVRGERHRDDQAIPPPGGSVVALEPHGRRQVRSIMRPLSAGSDVAPLCPVRWALVVACVNTSTSTSYAPKIGARPKAPSRGPAVTQAGTAGATLPARRTSA